jgi:FixJ family two-component response regulator
LVPAVPAKADQLDVRLAFVLDDEARMGSVVCKMLSALGIEARQFVLADEFLAALRICNPDLVFLDLALGQTDAIEVIHELEACAFKGRVLLISGRDSGMLMEVERIGRAHGLDMLPPLPKPFQIDDISDCLRPLVPLQPESPEQESATTRNPHPTHLDSKA